MARLTALPSIDIIRGFKGVLDFYLWKGLPCVRAWPRWRPARQSDPSKAAALLFGAIIKGYNLLGAGALDAFRADAADQTRSARDIYVSGVFGHLHERTEPPPPPPPPEVQMTGIWINPETVALSGSAFAWKGNYLKPMFAITLHALAAKGDWLQGITLKFALFTVSAGLIASVVYKSTGTTLPTPLDTNPSLSSITELFDPAWSLDAGTEYLLAVGRSDGADNYVLPVVYPTASFPAPFPCHENTHTGRVAKADPQVGDAVNNFVGGTLSMQATWTFT